MQCVLFNDTVSLWNQVFGICCDEKSLCESQCETASVEDEGGSAQPDLSVCEVVQGPASAGAIVVVIEEWNKKYWVFSPIYVHYLTPY